jgi:YggT family protein
VIIHLVAFVLELYLILLIARAVLSWFPVAPDGFMATVQRLLFAATEPVLAPLRSVLPPMRMGGMGLDLSPMIVMLAIIVLLQFIH